MQWPRWTVAIAFLSAQVPCPAVAGPVEQFAQVALHPTNADVMVVRYVNGGDGMFVTTDRGRNWQLLCDAALFNPVRTRGGPLVISGDGATTMGVFTGMWHDDGHACGWNSVPQYDGLWITNFAVDPVDPAITYAVTSTGGQLNGILQRDAAGSWSVMGSRAEILIADLHVVPHGGGRRFYLGAVNGEINPAEGGTPSPNYVIRMSDDNGANWTEHVYGVADGSLHVQAVDPTNPDRIIVTIERTEAGGVPPGAARDTVLVSGDRGATFTKYLTVTEIGGVTFAPDGRVWIGDTGALGDPTQPRGLWFAPSLEVPATKLPKSDYPVQYVDYQKATDTLYVGQPDLFGSADTKDGSFTTSLDVTKVAGFVACKGVDMGATCQTQLCEAYCGIGHFAQAPVCCAYSTRSCGPTAAISGTATCANLGGTAGTGGALDAGNRAGTTGAFPGGTNGTGGRSGGDPGGGAHDGGCCAVVGVARSGGAQPTALGLLVAAGLVLRRRRR